MSTSAIIQTVDQCEHGYRRRAFAGSIGAIGGALLIGQDNAVPVVIITGSSGSSSSSSPPHAESNSSSGAHNKSHFQ